MREEYRNLFSGVHASERLRAEVMNLKSREYMTLKRRRRIPAAAAAAVLAMVLAGTAFAAVIERLNMQVVPDGTDAGYTVTSGSLTKFPLSAFSPELLTASENRGERAVVDDLLFNKWDEVCAFLGRDIPCVWPDNGENWNNPFLVYLFHTGSDQLWGVDLYSKLTSDCVLAAVQVHIRTENWTGDTAAFGLRDSDPDGIYSQKECYQMANGQAAEIVQYVGSDEYPHAYCEGWFMRDGIVYEVTAYGTAATQDETLARIYEILDAYE